MGAPALSIFLSAKVYYAFPGVYPLLFSKLYPDQYSALPLATLIEPLALFTLVHFLINSWLIAFAVHFETGRKPFDVWRNDFLWLSLNYFGGASVSALFAVYTRDVDYLYISIIIPLLLILYFTFKIPMARVEDTNRHLGILNALYLSTIETLAMAIDAKDQVTHGHIRRVQTYAIGLAKSLHVHDPGLLHAIQASALLHDMGKLAIPEHILNKPGKLSPAEFEKMKLHASIGADLLSGIEFPYPVVPIVRHHHENWDGTGYPSGLKGTEIPLGARILAVVDCFDALTSDRPYRPRLSNQQANSILLERRGTMYDPLVVDTFLRIYPSLAPEEQPYTPAQATYLAQITQLQKRGQAEGINRPTTESERFLAQWFAPITQLRAFSQGELAAVVTVYDKRLDSLRVAWTSPGLEDAVGISMAFGKGLTGWAASTRRKIINSEATLDLAEIAPQAVQRFNYCMAVPLAGTQHELWGVLSLYSRPIFQEPIANLVDLLTSRLTAALSHLDQDGSDKQRHKCTSDLGPETLERHTQEVFEGTGAGAVEIRFQGLLGESSAQRFVCETERKRDVLDVVYAIDGLRAIWVRVSATGHQEAMRRASEIAHASGYSNRLIGIYPYDLSGQRTPVKVSRSA